MGGWGGLKNWKHIPLPVNPGEGAVSHWSSLKQALFSFRRVVFERLHEELLTSMGPEGYC